MVGSKCAGPGAHVQGMVRQFVCMRARTRVRALCDASVCVRLCDGKGKGEVREYAKERPCKSVYEVERSILPPFEQLIPGV